MIYAFCRWMILLVAFLFLLGLVEHLWLMKRRRDGRPWYISVDLAKGKDFSASQVRKVSQDGEANGR